MKTLDKMKTLKIGLAIVLMISSQLVSAQTEGEISIPLSNPGERAKVKIDIHKGGIIVKGSSRQDIKVTYKERSKDKDKEKSGVDKDGLMKISSGGLDLEAYEKNNTVSISSDSWNKAVDLIVEMPVNADLDVSTYNSGDIDVDNINGEVVAENYNGKITLMNIAGSTVADTYNGQIKVLLTSVTADTPMSFTTYNGNVDITFPSNTKGNLKLKSSRGDIYSGFEMSVTEAAPIQKKNESNGVYKVYLDDWTRGTINGGGPDITMKSYNGDIYVRSK